MRSFLLRPRRLPAVVLLVGLALPGLVALAACGDDDEATRTTDGPTTTDRDGPGPDGDEGDVVITVDVHGGFVPVEQAVADTAETVVQGDGTVLTPAPTIAIFPGPALTTFQVGHVDEAEVRDLVDAIEALDPDADYSPPGPPTVADAPDTTLTLQRGDDTVSITAYALGISADEGPRAELSAVVDRITGLVDAAGEELYEPTALRVHDVTDQAGDPPTETTGDAGEPTGRVLDWPLAHDGRDCTVIDEPGEVAEALEVLTTATQLDWFRTDTGVRRLVAAPLLPGDDGCPDA